MKRIVISLSILVLSLSLGLTACSQATPTTAPTKPAVMNTEQVAPTKVVDKPTDKPVDKPTDKPAVAAVDGKTTLETACTKCHNLDRIQSKKKSAADWKTTVERMIGKGAQLNDNEKQAVIQYLAATYPQ